MIVWHYLSADGTDPFQIWLDGLRDLSARVAILRRIDRLASGNKGDCKFCRAGVWEMRVDVGPGYRVYYVYVDASTVLLLSGGTKRTQQADIDRAVAYWKDYRSRR